MDWDYWKRKEAYSKILPALEYEENVAFLLMASKSKLDVPLIHKIEEVNASVKEGWIAEDLVNKYSAKEWYKKLLTFKEKFNLFVDDEHLEEFEEVFGMAMPMTDGKYLRG